MSIVGKFYKVNENLRAISNGNLTLVNAIMGFFGLTGLHGVYAI